MNYLHLHPDGLVYIRDENDVELYCEPLHMFAVDYGTHFPALPSGVNQMELFDGRVYVWDIKQNERDGGHLDPFPFQQILDALPRLLEAKQKRLSMPSFGGDFPKMPLRG